MLRKRFMQKKIHSKDIQHVIGHNGSIYFKQSIVTILLLILLYVVSVIATPHITYPHISRIFGGIAVVIFLKYTVDFLNLYLDGLALSSEWLTLFLREWLLEYKTEYFDRDKIVTINHQQKWIRDKLFYKWDILINLEQWIEFPFENVTAPKKQVDKIMRLKERYHQKQDHNYNPTSTDGNNDDRMQIVMEAFSEVVKEYIDKKDQQNQNSQETFF